MDAVRQRRSCDEEDPSGWHEPPLDSFPRSSSPSRDLFLDLGHGLSSAHSPLFNHRSQSIIFFDWDETLYPTSEIFDRWGVNYRDEVHDLSPLQQKLLEEWASALYDYLREACRLSAQVVIVTNSKTPWVRTSVECLAKFAPKLQELFASDDSCSCGVGGEIKVVYAVDEMNKSMIAESFCCQPKKQACAPSVDEEIERLTNAKYFVMDREVKAFYSQYARQTWKNILSLGDMHYEHDAIQEVTFIRRAPSNKSEHVRTKAIVLPTEPTLSEITLRLRFSKRMLPAYVAFDGDLDLDLRAARDPLLEIAKALGLPDLAEIQFSRHAWGRECTPAPEDDVPGMLAAVAKVVGSKVSL